MSPMMSNGPLLVPQVVPEPLPLDRRRVDLRPDRSARRPCEIPRGRASAASGGAGGPGCGSRAARSCGRRGRRSRSRQIASGRFRTIATGSTSCALASATSGWRDSGCTLVASITVSLPARRRLAAMKCSTSNASGPSRPGRSRRPRRGRGNSRTRESPSAGSAWRERALARSGGTDQDDEAQVGDVICMGIVYGGSTSVSLCSCIDCMARGSTAETPPSASASRAWDPPGRSATSRSW